MPFFPLGFVLTISSTFAFCCNVSAQEVKVLPLSEPTVFKAYIGGFTDNYSLELKPDGVHYQAMAGPQVTESIVVHPSLEAWKDFIRKLNSAQVSSWATKYPDKDFDGTQWRFTLNFGESTVNSQGNNSYPNDEKPQESSQKPGKSFGQFCHAISTLVGRPFR